ncbi:GFA family protein [Sphingobium sp. AN558]|uniref:GFA family protein n=1 Tax=Sphingobium sp. AN558 TaxID=3133442 RepID=UPI0030C54581
MSLSGGCRCGDCRYDLDRTALPAVYACHCRDCQTMSGAAFTLQAPVPVTSLSQSGQVAEWTKLAGNGHDTIQRACARCMTRLYSVNAGRPGVALLRAGTLDRSDEVAPLLHLWTDRKQAWIALPPEAEAYARAAPAGRMEILFAVNFS